MAFVAQIKFVQGATIGTPGVALFGTLGVLVTASNADNSQVVRWRWVMIAVPTGSAISTGLVSDGTTQTMTFTPDATGGYHVELTTFDSAGNQKVHRLVFGVKEGSGRFIPPYDAEKDALNFGGNSRGWAPYVEEYFKAFDLGGGGGMPGIFNVKDYGAVGNADTSGNGTDDRAAIQAAIDAAKQYTAYNNGLAVAGGRVYFPPGRYRCSDTLNVNGSVILEGTHGSGLWASSVILFDVNTGHHGINIEAGTQSADYAQIRDLGIVGNPFQVRNNLTPRKAAIRVAAHGVVLEDVYVASYQGDGIEIDGGSTNANNWHLAGHVRVYQNERYGVFVHGADGNAGSCVGMLDCTGNFSWGVFDQSFLGNSYDAIHTQGNGYCVQSGNWVHDGATVGGANVWSAAATITLGQRILPTPANKCGFRFVATSIGAAPHQTGGVEPNWSGITAIGQTVADGNITWTAEMEEGGPFRVKGANNNVKVGWLYAEADQGEVDWPDGLGFLGGGAGNVLSLASRLGFAIDSDGRAIPMEFRTRRQESWDVNRVKPIRVCIGDPIENDPNVAMIRSAADTPDVVGHYTSDVAKMRDYWDQSKKRWMRQWYPQAGSYEHFGWTETMGRSGPMPGAVCFPSVWMGGIVDKERRFVALPPNATTPYAPDFTNAVYSARGAYKPNDVIWNTGGEAGEGLPAVPAAWRVTQNGGLTHGFTWNPNHAAFAGMIIRPGTPNDSLFRARTYGVMGALSPNFAGADGPGGSVVEGDITWDWWGYYSSGVQTEPLIATRPIEIPKTVTGGTLTLSLEESAAERLHFSGTLVSDQLVIIKPGAGLGGFRTIRNDTTGAFTLTVRAGGGAGVQVAQGKVTQIYIDSADVLPYDPGTAVPPTMAGSLLAGWFRADYAGLPWAGTASAGTSGSKSVVNDVAHGGSPPTVGALQNGFAPAAFNGGQWAWDGTAFSADYVSAAAGTIAVLFYATAAAAAAAQPYDDPALWTDNGGNHGISFSTSGVIGWITDGGGVKKITQACGTGAYHLAIFRWDSANVKLRLDSVDGAPVAAGAATGLGASRPHIGMNYAHAAGFQGRILEVFTAQAALSDSAITAFKAELNTRYGLAL